MAACVLCIMISFKNLVIVSSFTPRELLLHLQAHSGAQGVEPAAAGCFGLSYLWENKAKLHVKSE